MSRNKQARHPHQHRDMPRQSKLKVEEMEGKQEPSPTSSEEKKSKKENTVCFKENWHSVQNKQTKKLA